jgi:hypothetical protein
MTRESDLAVRLEDLTWLVWNIQNNTWCTVVLGRYTIVAERSGHPETLSACMITRCGIFSPPFRHTCSLALGPRGNQAKKPGVVKRPIVRGIPSRHRYRYNMSQDSTLAAYIR